MQATSIMLMPASHPEAPVSRSHRQEPWAAAAAGIAAVLASGCVIVHDGIEPGDPLYAQFFLTWETVDSMTGIEIDCASVGANTIRTTASNVTTGDELVDLFDCRDQAGATYPLSAGRYWVTVELLRCGDAACTRPVALSSSTTVGSYGVYSDTDIDLGHFVFYVDNPFTAAVHDADGTSKDVTEDSDTIWNTSDAATATVEDGMVTTLAEAVDVSISASYLTEKADEHFANTP